MAPSIETLSPFHDTPSLHNADAKDLPEKLVSHIKAINGNVGVDKVKASAEKVEDHSVPFNDQYAFQPRKLRIITIGAGFSGLLLAHKFQHRFPELQEFVEHTIFEARDDLGGTWLVNTYPGVQCDVPAHIYVWLFNYPRRGKIPKANSSEHSQGIPI